MLFRSAQARGKDVREEGVLERHDEKDVWARKVLEIPVSFRTRSGVDWSEDTPRVGPRRHRGSQDRRGRVRVPALGIQVR